MNVIGIEDVVEVEGLFDANSIGVFVNAVVRGARNVYENLTTFAIAGVIAASVGATAPVAARTDAPFLEPAPIAHEELRWAASLDNAAALIASMQAGERPAYADHLGPLAGEAIVGLQSRTQDVGSWANALALEVADIDD